MSLEHPCPGVVSSLFYVGSLPGKDELTVRGGLTATRVCLSFSSSARTLCCSALSARRFSCSSTHTRAHTHTHIHTHCNCLLGGASRQRSGTPSWKTYDPVNESDEILLVLLPLNEVGLDQSLQLGQILLQTLPVDVLQSHTHLICLDIVLRTFSALYFHWTKTF